MAIRWFHHDADEELDAPSEWTHAWGALEVTLTQLGSLRVSSGGERLPVSRGWVGGAERVGFRWPRRDPGSHAVRVECPGLSASETVRVAARKLGDDARAATATRWLSPLCRRGELGAVERELRIARAALRALGEVTPLPGAPTRVTTVLARRPDYRAALEGLQELTRSSTARLEDAALTAPLDNVPMLYQRWGTLRLLVATLRAAAAHGRRVHPPRFFASLLGEAVVRLLPDGRAALTMERGDGATVKVIPERTYKTSGVLRSMTYEQRPDVAIERWSPIGGHAVWLFDPKYKLAADDEGASKPVKADVDKMHAYRDAIRDERGRRVVRYAALLYPGETHRWGDEIAALGAHPERPSVLDGELDAVLDRVLHGDG